MGRHIAEGRKRGIAGWPILVLSVIVVLVAGTIAYFALLRNHDAADTGECTGSATLPLLASSGASPAARALSDAFNATLPVARSTCLTTSVTSLPGPTAAAALIDHWQGRSEPAPGVWLTDDGSTLLDVDAQASDLTAGRDADPLATSPVVLAMRDADAARATGLSWQKLPSELGSGGSARSADGKPIPLRLSDPRTNRATGYAAESMLGSDGAAVTVAKVERGAAELRSLRTAGTDQPTTGDALDQLAGGNSPGAVPVTEADLAAFNTGNDSALAAVYPSGPTAGDQLFAVALSADWVTPTVRDAASQFTAFTRSPQGTAVLTAAHFRVPGAKSSAGSGVRSSTPVTPLPPADAGVSAAVAAALGFPGSMPTVPGDGATGSPPAVSSSTTGAATPSVSTGAGAGIIAPPTGSATATPRTTTPKSTSTPRSTVATTTTAVKPTTSSGSRPPATTRTSSVHTTPPATPSANVTLLVDTAASWAAVIDGKTRIQWLQQGLTDVLGNAGNVGIGLWETSSTAGDAGYAQLVTTGPLTGAVDGGIRKSALQQAIGQLTADGAKRYYAATPAVMTEAATTATATLPGRVVLVTDGADQTPNTPRASVIAAISAIADANPSLRLDVIGVGDAAPGDALGELAAAGNGSYQHVNTADLPAALVAAVQP
ncbi:substrate-binding domain-containing protein [Nakamurella lactea]|uniref:substrate-binding domain-containing protein n=1 Tax=Nakamurella lactea TaxID=459515 RepID=UPI00041ACA38|nr:substrate-binding domain-containing protein [Nakamurella lactea]